MTPRIPGDQQVPEEAVDVVAWHIAANDGCPRWDLVVNKEPFRNAATALLEQAAPAIRAQERERLAERLEEVDAGLSDLRATREHQDKWDSVAYLQGRQHECRNQAAALRGLHTADLRASALGEALTRVVRAARHWLTCEHGDARPDVCPADKPAAQLHDALAALKKEAAGA
jgi:aminoglycoside phosphotransferase